MSWLKNWRAAPQSSNHPRTVRLQVEHLEARENPAPATLPFDLTGGGSAVWQSFDSNAGTAFRVANARLGTSLTNAISTFWMINVGTTPAINPAFNFNPGRDVDLTTTDKTHFLTSAVAQVNGLNVQQRFAVLRNESTLRILVTFQNPGDVDLTRTVTVSGVLGIGSNAVVAQTSNGTDAAPDTVFDPTDRWFFTTGSANNDRVVNTLAFWGNGSVLDQPTTATLAGPVLTTQFDVTVPAHQTRSLMFFHTLTSSTTAAKTRVARLNSLLAMENNELLRGINYQQRHEILNWDVRPPLSLAGAGNGGSPIVQIIDGAGNIRSLLYAYEGTFKGGVRVALGDVNGDAIPDIITAPGAGRETLIRVFNSRTGVLQYSFRPFEAGYQGGANVAVGDVNGDGVAEILVGSGTNRAAEVRVFNGRARDAQGQQVELMAARLTSALLGNIGTGGVRVAAGDLNGTLRNGSPVAEVVAAPATGGDGRVRAFQTTVDAMGNVTAIAPLAGFTPIDAYAGTQAGIFITVGDINGDRRADIVTANGNGPVRVRLFNGFNGSEILTEPATGFPVFETKFTGGGRVALTDVNRDGRLDLLTGMGPGLYPTVNFLDVRNNPLINRFQARLITSIYAFDSTFLGGVFVAGNATR